MRQDISCCQGLSHKIANKSEKRNKRSLRIWTAYEKNMLQKAGIKLSPRQVFGQMPVEYIVGFCDFLGREFEVNRAVLIPRIETERLVKLAEDAAVSMFELRGAGSDPQPIKILDLGTGSGCVGISLFLQLQAKGVQAEIVLTDVSRDCLSVAQRNLLQLLNGGQQQQFTLILSDIFNEIPLQQFDIVVSNPPYIPTTNLAELEPSVSEFEPVEALDGGSDGLKFVRAIIENAIDYLVPSGKLFIEIDSRAKVSDSSLKIDKKSWLWRLHQDEQGRQRYLEVWKVDA